jgi:hypothetical protein
MTAALTEKPAPAQFRTGIENFAAALSATRGGHSDDSVDPYGDMHAALELVLDEDSDLEEAVRYLLAIAGLAARLTSTGANPNGTRKGRLPTPCAATRYLLAEPAT